MFDRLTRPLPGERWRTSSWDRSGGNADYVTVDAGAEHALLDVQGAGVIRHIWLTVNCQSETWLRDLVLEMYWDGSENPAVLCPLGDFFVLGHSRVAPVTCQPFTVVTGGDTQKQGRAALNCWFHMPFGEGARVVIRNEGTADVEHLFYYVDFDVLPDGQPSPLRFHAHYRQEYPTSAELDLASPDATWDALMVAENTDAQGNYVLVDTHGSGHYVGCVLNVDHLNPMQTGGWFGEGDDMIFIDGRPGLGLPGVPPSSPEANDAWPPTLSGTGTEDYFCAAWGYPAGVHNTPYHGVTLAGPAKGTTFEYSGKWTMYRFHLPDPIMFSESLRVTIEHGHANCHSSDYSSVAYWYQTPRDAPLPPLPAAAERHPATDRRSMAAYLRTRQ